MSDASLGEIRFRESMAYLMEELVKATKANTEAIRELARAVRESPGKPPATPKEDKPGAPLQCAPPSLHGDDTPPGSRSIPESQGSPSREIPR